METADVDLRDAALTAVERVALWAEVPPRSTLTATVIITGVAMVDPAIARRASAHREVGPSIAWQGPGPRGATVPATVIRRGPLSDSTGAAVCAQPRLIVCHASLRHA